MAYTSALYANMLALHVYIYYVTCFDMNYFQFLRDSKKSLHVGLGILNIQSGHGIQICQTMLHAPLT